jgi:hypothetical protein
MFLIQEGNIGLLLLRDSLQSRIVKMIRMFMRNPNMRNALEVCRSHCRVAKKGPRLVERLTEKPRVSAKRYLSVFDQD